MSNALETAYHPDAPPDERRSALSEAQQAALPSSVPDMMALAAWVAEQYEEQQMAKALTRPDAAPFPSRAVRSDSPGMQSVWLDDQRVQLLGPWYERPSAFTFETMRSMVDQTPILSSIVLTRQRQVKRFCRVQENGKGPGFQIALKDRNAKIDGSNRDKVRLLENFLTNCGWETNPGQRMGLRRDNFSGLMAKLVRDSLIMDSAPIETEYKRDRRRGLDGLYAVDGATIRLCNEVGYEGDDAIFALQVVDGLVRTAYTYDDLIYVPRNPRTDVLVGGYGMSETELLVRVVTGFLNALTYNLKYFDSNAIPKGMLHLSGDYSQDDLAAFKRYWNAMVKGINNAWTLPVMVSKNQESKASFENFGVDVSEIMFAKWMTFLTSIACAIYGMAPDEINFESFTAGTSSLSGSDTEEKLINSKDKGMRPLLAHFEDLFSDYVIAEFSDDFVFRWTGLDEENEQLAWERDRTILTLDEARKAQNLEALGDELGNAPLNQALMGVYMQKLQNAQEDYGDPEEGGAAFGSGNDADDDTGSAAKRRSDTPDAELPATHREEVQKAFGLPVWRIEP